MASAALEPIADGVMAWLSSTPGHGRTNVGLVVEDDGVTLIDCLLTPALAQPLAELIAEFDLPVRRLVYTSSHVEFVGGSAVFWMAARYGRRQTSVLLDQQPNVEVYRHLYPDEAASFDDEFATRPVSHTVETAAWLSPAVCALPMSGHQRENLVALLPAADVVFAGAMCVFGTTPNAFDGDPSAWADALAELGELASTIVPGIGPIGGPPEVAALQAYLSACVDAAGDVDAIPTGPWDDWTDRHLDAVNVERAALLAAGDDRVPDAMLRLAGLGPES